MRHFQIDSYEILFYCFYYLSSYQNLKWRSTKNNIHKYIPHFFNYLKPLIPIIIAYFITLKKASQLNINRLLSSTMNTPTFTLEHFLLFFIFPLLLHQCTTNFSGKLTAENSVIPRHLAY